VFDHALMALEAGREGALGVLETTLDLPRGGERDLRARLAAEPYFAALARDTDDEETRGYIEIGVRMFRDLANRTDPTDHGIRDVVLRQASCTDLSWAGGSRYLLLQAMRESLLEPGPIEASAVEARLMLRLGPVLGFECRPRTGPLKKAVPLPRSTREDLARAGIPLLPGRDRGADPPAVLSTFLLLAFARLHDHRLISWQCPWLRRAAARPRVTATATWGWTSRPGAGLPPRAAPSAPACTPPSRPGASPWPSMHRRRRAPGTSEAPSACATWARSWGDASGLLRAPGQR
jgi:hypothetical protein